MNNKSPIDYDKSLEYWADIPATVDGVLGGFGFISNADIEGSKLFLKAIFSFKDPPSSDTALDCGAGIGRITKHLLIQYFKKVDVIEPDEKFINSLLDYVGDDKVKVGSLYKVSLQDFKPERKYDVIWNQWVLGYLTDEDLFEGCGWQYTNKRRSNLVLRVNNAPVTNFKQNKKALSANGVIVIKENVTSTGKIETDETDSSVTRPLKQYLQIFKKANLKRMKQCKQTNFPNGIYPVYMIALIPDCNAMDPQHMNAGTKGPTTKTLQSDT